MNAAGMLFLTTLSAASPELHLLSQARFAERAGDLKRAAVLARTALEMNRSGEKLAVHREAQDVLIAAGRGAELVRFYDDLLRGDAADPVRRYLRARVEPDATRRRRDLEAVLLKDPGLFWAAYDLAELHARAGDWERAAACAERAVEISPGEAAAWNVLGHLRLESSRFLRDAGARRKLALGAREAIDRAIGLEPELAEAHYNLGLVRYALGEKLPARKSFLRALELKADLAEALNALGHMSARDGDLDEAVSFYQKALTARPDYGSAHNNIAVAYHRKGEHAHAFKHMAKAEAAGHAVAPPLRRAVIREEERRAFMAFQRELAGVRSRSARVLVPGRDEAAVLSELQRREIRLAALRLRFRDSGGGVRLGRRRVRGKPVAHYREAARVELDVGGGRSWELLVVARESASRRGALCGETTKLVTWVAEAGFRFSAEAPELVRLVSRFVGLEVEAAADL